MCVPRWRAIMCPERTHSPPNFLTPSRCELLSRPLRLEPAPFLWAMCVCLPFYRVDHQARVRFAMAALLALAFLSLIAICDHLGRPELIDNGGVDGRAGNGGCAHGDAAVVDDQQHLAEGVGRTGLDGQAVDLNRGALDAAELPRARADDGVLHCVCLQSSLHRRRPGPGWAASGPVLVPARRPGAGKTG